MRPAQNLPASYLVNGKMKKKKNPDLPFSADIL